jgi:hypothetical protein
MAVLDAIPGLKVFICIDGKPLEEYDDDEEEEVEVTPIAEYQAAKTVRKYVESISDTEFSIKIMLETPFVMDYESLMAPIAIDGKHMLETVIVKERYPINIRESRVVSAVSRIVPGIGIRAPGNEEHELLQKFKFAKIDTSKLRPPPYDQWANNIYR